MRHLLVPACVFLVTLSGTAGSDPKLLLEPLAVGPDEKQVGVASTQEISVEARTTTVQKTAPEAAESKVSLSAPIDIPMQSESEQRLQPDIAEPIPLPPVRKPVVERSHREICDTLATAARSNDLPVPFFIRLLFQESRFQPGVVSHAGAEGIAQFMPETAAGMGLQNAFDPLQAIPASARLLRDLMQKFGNLGLAAAAYNAGPKRIHDWLSKKGKLPEETQGYVKIITGRPAETWTVASAGHAEMRLPRRAPCQEMVGLHAWDGPEQIPLPPTRTPAETAVAAKHRPATLAEKEKTPNIRVAELKIANKEPAKAPAKEPVKEARAASKDVSAVTAKSEKKIESKDTGKVTVRAAARQTSHNGAKAGPEKSSVQLAARQRKEAR